MTGIAEERGPRENAPCGAGFSKENNVAIEIFGDFVAPGRIAPANTEEQCSSTTLQLLSAGVERAVAA